MAKISFPGINEYAEQVSQFVDRSEGMIKRAVYDGAHVVMEAMKAEIGALPEVKSRYYKDGRNLPLRGITATQKRGLLDSIGYAKMRDDGGYVNTKIGFDGYNDVSTKKYPNGQPNALVARAVNSGSSVRVKIPFVNRAVKAAKAACEEAMRKRIDEDTKEIMK